MPQVALTTIAQLLYAEMPALNFARLVSDLEAVLARFPSSRMQLTWDHEDVAVFDMPGLRILLAWSEAPGQGLAGCLTLSAGPSAKPPLPGTRQKYDTFCSRLVERVQARLLPTALLWRQLEGLITAETVDSLVETLPKLPDVVGTGAPLELTVPGLAANDHHGENHDPELARLRRALYEFVPDDGTHPRSAQMRLAVHAMNATLIVVWMPLGAAVMTYTLLKGEDLRVSARLMVLSGTIATLAQSSFGQQMAAMASGLT